MGFEYLVIKRGGASFSLEQFDDQGSGGFGAKYKYRIYHKDIVTINDVTIWVNNHKIFHKQNINKTFLPHMKKNFHKVKNLYNKPDNWSVGINPSGSQAVSTAETNDNGVVEI